MPTFFHVLLRSSEADGVRTDAGPPTALAITPAGRSAQGSVVAHMAEQGVTKSKRREARK